jgi:hypothetical protein
MTGNDGDGGEREREHSEIGQSTRSLGRNLQLHVAAVCTCC